MSNPVMFQLSGLYLLPFSFAFDLTGLLRDSLFCSLAKSWKDKLTPLPLHVLLISSPRAGGRQRSPRSSQTAFWLKGVYWFLLYKLHLPLFSPQCQFLFCPLNDHYTSNVYFSLLVSKTFSSSYQVHSSCWNKVFSVKHAEFTYITFLSPQMQIWLKKTPKQTVK